MSILRIKDPKTGKWEPIDALIGKEGPVGPPNTLSIGSVTKGTEASASITGTSPNQRLNLVLPKGDTGPQGVQGEPGYTPQKGTDYFTDNDINYIFSKIKNFEIIYGIFDTAPIRGFKEGDKYYNTNDKLIYTAIDLENWSNSSEEPKTNILYLSENDKSISIFYNKSMQKFDNNIEEKLLFLSDKSYINLYLSENQNISQGNNQILFMEDEAVGNYFKREGSKIIVSQDCCALISGNCFVEGSLGLETRYCWSKIMVNNIVISDHLERIFNTDFTHASVPSKAINLKEGDIITMVLEYASNDGVPYIRSSKSSTFLSVVKI